MKPPSIPETPTVFCFYCAKHKPRAAIVSAEWRKGRRGGYQAKYRCRSCEDNLRRYQAQAKHGR